MNPMKTKTKMSWHEVEARRIDFDSVRLVGQRGRQRKFVVTSGKGLIKK